MWSLCSAHVLCPRCRHELSRYQEEDVAGNVLSDELLCARATGGCGLEVPNTNAANMEALSCAS